MTPTTTEPRTAASAGDELGAAATVFPSPASEPPIEVADSRFGAAIYEIKRRNLLQNTGLDPDVDGTDDLAPIGEVTSQGFEIEGAVDLTPNWVLTATYAYNDARITATVMLRYGSDTTAVVRRMVVVPGTQGAVSSRPETNWLETSASMAVVRSRRSGPRWLRAVTVTGR